MRHPLLYLVSLFFFISACDSPDEEIVEATSVDSNSVELATIPEEEVNEEGELIWKLAGEYVFVKQDEGAPYYEDPCNFNPYDVSIHEVVEHSGEWEIDWMGEIYPIASVEEKDGRFYILTESEYSSVIILTDLERELWDFLEMGSLESSLAVNLVDLQYQDFKPCEDEAEIMRFQKTTWYELTNLDGELVIVQPCYGPVDGITLGDSAETIEFWGEGDPYTVLSLSKRYDRISIVYQGHDGELNNITMRRISDNVVQFGRDKENDPYYVHEEAKNNFPMVEEECD